MSNPVNFQMPCSGDAFVSRTSQPGREMRTYCDWCGRYHMNIHGAAMGSCLGPEGWPFMAHTAAEVARERATGPSVTGGTVTKLTITYPPGTDPRLVQNKGRWTS